MAAYLIVDVDIHNPEAYEGYKKLTPAAIAAYDGKFIVRGGETEVLEGDWKPNRIVVLEFPDADKARAFWHSEEYAAPKLIRQENAATNMILVNGVSEVINYGR